MNETPGADFGGFMGWWVLAIGVVVALATDGDMQALGMWIAGAGLAIALFARSTRPLEQAVMDNARTSGGFCGLIGLMLLIIIVMGGMAIGILQVGGGL